MTDNAVPLDQPTTVGTTRGRRLAPIVAGVAGVSIVLGAGGVFAASKLAPKAGDPEDVLPGSTFAFVKVDLDPSIGQKAAYLKLRALTGAEDSKDQLGKDPQAVVCEALLANLNCDTGVKPWLGDRFAAAAWPGDAGTTHSVYVLKTTDEAGAKAALAAKYPTAVVENGFVVLDAQPRIRSAAALAAAVQGSGRFADNASYAADIASLKTDGVANLWMDLKPVFNHVISAATKQAPEVSDQLKPVLEQRDKVKGTAAAALSITDSGLQFTMQTRGMDMSQAPTGAGLTQLGELPRDSQVAIGGIGLAQNLQQAVSQDDAMRTSVESSLEPFGITGIRDIAKLIGTETAVAMSMSKGTDPQFAARLKGADLATVRSAADVATTGSDGEQSALPQVRVAESGGVVTASMGTPSGGRLADSPAFAKAVPALDRAALAGFVDLERLADADEEVSDLKDAGAVGFSVRYDAQAALGEAVVNWVITD